jgi:hypothetical protein
VTADVECLVIQRDRALRIIATECPGYRQVITWTQGMNGASYPLLDETDGHCFTFTVAVIGVVSFLVLPLAWRGMTEGMEGIPRERPGFCMQLMKRYLLIGRLGRRWSVSTSPPAIRMHVDCRWA